MAASASRGQALSLIDRLCVHTSDSTRLHERFVVKCISRLPQATPPTLVSALQRQKAYYLRAAPKCYNRQEVDNATVYESEKAPKKGRRRKSPPLGSKQDNGSTTSRRKSKQGILSLVRTVDNAEDNSNESSTCQFAARHESPGAKSEDKFTEGEQSLTYNVGHSTSHTKPNHEATIRLAKNTAGAASEKTTRQHHRNAGSNNIDPGIRTVVNGMGTVSHKYPSSETSSKRAATSSRRKPGQQRRKKSDGELFEEDCSPLKPDMDAVSQAVGLESNAKIGENVVDFAESLSSLSSSPSFHTVVDIEKGAEKARDVNAAGLVDESEKVTRVRSHTASVTAVDGRALEGLLQGQKEFFRMPKSVKRIKKLQKQLSAEEINASVKECEGIEISEHDQVMCNVWWLVETQLDVHQNIFLVGEHPNLGAWDPSKAIGFSLSEKTGNFNLWQGRVQVPFGTSSEYNYFVQLGDEKTYHTVWRPGPRLSFSTPPKGSDETELIIKDALDFNIANKLPALLWEGLQNEIGFPIELKRFLGDENVLKESSDHTTLETDSGNRGQSDLRVQGIVKETKDDFLDFQRAVEVNDFKSDTLQNYVEDVVFADKPELDEASITSVKLTPKLQRYIRKRVFPREEPWLMESMILLEKSEALKQAAANLAAATSDEIDEDDSQITVLEKSAEKEEKLIEILINSSKCTMERIAILENGKLVELLLKPVNSDINVGNVYLGVVKKLLPGMTGVFVDIGHPRVALLSITKNMYPFTFPPIGNGSSVDDHNDDAEGHLFEKQGILLVEPCESDEKCNDVVEEDWETENEEDEEDEEPEAMIDMGENAEPGSRSNASHEGELNEKRRGRKLRLVKDKGTRPITVNFGQRFTKWRKVEEGMRIIVQVKREPLGKKGPKVCAFPQLSSRFWVLGLGGKSTGVSKKIYGPERKRLKDLANLFKKPGFELTVRTEAAGQSQEDLEKDLARLLETWKDIMEQAESASFAAQNGQDGAVPSLLHRAMGQTLSLVRDFFAEKVQRMVVDSAQTYHEVTCYLQDVAPQLQNRVELYTGTTPIFDVFNLEADIDKILKERVQLPNGAYLVIEETEALVTIDVNGGAGMLGKNMKSAAILEANLAAARQIAAELRLRDIGGIIVIDFIDMDEEEHESLVYEEMRKAIQSDRSIIFLSEISELGLMELTRRRVRPSVSFMISDPCACCHGTGRVEALETTFSKIERAVLRLVANDSENIHFDGRTWKKVLLRVDPVMFEFLTRKQRAAKLSSSLKVYIILKVGREMSRGSFDLSELKLENEKQVSRIAQQNRPLRKGVRMGAGEKKGITSRG